MAIITAGVGATIAATTAEGQAFQLLQWWQLQEENTTINPLGQEWFTGAKNTDTNNKFFEGTWKIPATFTTTTPLTIISGIIYQNLVFTPGTTPGTFNGLTATAYTLQLLLWLVNREINTQFNPDKFEHTTAIYDARLGVYEGKFKLPYITSLLPNGGTQDVARPYLL
ncbi:MULTISPECIES: hypothetical protein [unclassified Microcoleus]|uniref:hypothetical protein n=1 Tax=unclassified Microcoleus TaxID=2642155 RepID=UPI001D2E20E0|nr:MULTISPECIES: hypothetical protein [unclassified Microcoleus]MCC3473989.1 hypothetical protein [Microcoleus sp. PH2017_13_LAR_U_A]MCC3486071.1 hypothetical protein [Microcoleus sp. PH2017_14_LAR_D_A]MCC3598603.1 hypothetical protein [Microcoleus sp. PH2017_26_ELK_O_A]MCC3623915.1 hypothetical protein [Microcoleus sp. PH2017_36_ELK_O_B]